MKFQLNYNLIICLFSLAILSFACGGEGNGKKGFKPKFDDDPTIYSVRVKTGCDSLAGTEANITFFMVGENGQSQEFTIERPGGGKKITPCETTVMELQVDKDLGQLSKLEVWHDNSNEDPSWLPEIITVVNTKNNVRWDFPCGKWFDKNQFDQRIRRTFYTNRECN